MMRLTFFSGGRILLPGIRLMGGRAMFGFRGPVFAPLIFLRASRAVVLRIGHRVVSLVRWWFFGDGHLPMTWW